MTDSQIRPRSLRLAAPAKVNLNLHVTGRQADGYHLLESTVVFADFGDEIVLSPASDTTLEVTGAFAAGLETGNDNLVVAAYERLNRLVGGTLAPVHITLEKKLPVASGIGGGSSDAAATLNGLIRQFDLTIDTAGLQALALSLGADVPVCLSARSVIMSGIGERLLPIKKMPEFHAVLVNPGVGVSTAKIFDSLAIEPGQSAFAALPALPTGCEQSRWLDWLAQTRNDLQPIACELEPSIARVLAGLRDTASCQLARMSGSGATCFGLYNSRNEARAAARAIATKNPHWWVQSARLAAVRKPGQRKSR